MTKKPSSPLRALAILAGACVAVILAGSATAPAVQADDFPAPFHFSFFDDPPKKVHRRHHVKKAAPAALVAAPAEQPKAADVVTSVPPEPVKAAEPAAAPVQTVTEAPLAAPVTAVPTKADVDELKKSDPLAQPLPGDDGHVDTSSTQAFLFSAPVVAGGAIGSGVNAVHAATGGGWKFVVAMVLIVVGGLGALRLAAVKLKGAYSVAWKFAWSWIKWGAAMAWWLAKQGGAYAWVKIKAAYAKLLARFEAWRAAKATTAPTTSTSTTTTTPAASAT